MIDYGLLLSVLLAFSVPTLATRWWPLSIDVGPEPEAPSFLDVALWPAAVGVLVGRMTTLALDDPSSMTRFADVIIVRSGVEFWPGVLAASMTVAWSASRSSGSPLATLAGIAPLAVLGYAAYEAACLFRDGCFGPSSRIGLQPAGVASPMLPIGMFMAGALVAVAAVVRLTVDRKVPSAIVILLAVLGVATVRSVASFWLPHVGTTPTRQHVLSIAVVIVSASWLSGSLWQRHRARLGAG